MTLFWLLFLITALTLTLGLNGVVTNIVKVLVGRWEKENIALLWHQAPRHVYNEYVPLMFFHVKANDWNDNEQLFTASHGHWVE